MQAEFAALSQRRVPLAYPVLDLNRFVDDIEGTAFMGCSEEFILSQIYNEIVKERQAHLEANEAKLQAAQQRQRDSFACLAEALVKAIQALETDTDKIITTAAQVGSHGGRRLAGAALADRGANNDADDRHRVRRRSVVYSCRRRRPPDGDSHHVA